MQQPVRLVVLGAPGAGKGTQAARFGKSRGVPKISTGDTLREAVQEGTPLGLASKAIMDAGQLVGDDIMIGIVKERLSRPDTRPGFVLDGFPRTVAQAVALDTMIDGAGPVIVVNFEVPEEQLIERLTLRRICAKCGWNAVPGMDKCAQCGGPLIARRDDSVDIVRERLRIYGRDTQPLV